MPDDLTPRRTVIGGQTAPDDYAVIWENLTIGRIFKTVAVGGGDAWRRFISPDPQTVDEVEAHDGSGRRA